MTYKIATWNVNSLRVRLPQVLLWLQQYQPDVLAIQETKLEDLAFPQTELEAAGYHISFSGQKTYNGVAILSKQPMMDIANSLPGSSDSQKRLLAATSQDIRIINVYVPNGESVGTEKYFYKLSWLAQLKMYLQEQLVQYKKLIVLGDFNIAPDARDVHDPAAWEGRILFSEPERAQLQDIFALGLHDVLRLREADAGIYSWWDYRAAGFRRNLGMRIDLILISQTLCAAYQDMTIDKVARAAERPSDHAPVLAEFNF